MIDKNKQYKTRGGLPVQIYATDCGGHRPVHGAICSGGDWYIRSWTKDGFYVAGNEGDMDLVEVKPRIQRTEWFNIYDHGTGRGCKTKEEADHTAGEHRKACIEIPIDCEEGEGL